MIHVGMREVSTPMNDPRYPEIKQNRNAVSKKSSQVDIGGLATASYHLPSEQCVFFFTQSSTRCFIGILRMDDPHPLVNVYITMEHHHDITGKLTTNGPCSIANC